MPAPSRQLRSSPRRAPERGTVLIVTLLVMALLALGLGSYLTLNLSTSRLSRQGYQQNAAFHLAEAGAEEALWSFNRASAGNSDAWDGWTRQNSAAWKKFTGFDYGGNTTGSVKVYVTNAVPGANDRPTVVALSDVEAPDTPANTRMISVTVNRRSYFANGLVATDTLLFNGNNVSIDSWNSDPDNDPATAPIPYSAAVRNDRGSIATTAVQNNKMLVNQANVWGYVATGGGAPEVGTQGSIRGANTAAGVTIDPARVSTDFAADLPTVSLPTDGTLIAAVGATLGTAGTATKWRCNSIVLKGSDTLTIQGAVTLVLTATTGTALDVAGNASIIVPVGSSLTLYAAADIKIAGNGLSNPNTRAVSCQIWGTGTSASAQNIQVAGNGALNAIVYAPNADVKVNGNGDIMGAVVAKLITFTGNANFHYDESLANFGDNTAYGVTTWRELNTAAQRDPWTNVFSGW